MSGTKCKLRLLTLANFTLPMIRAQLRTAKRCRDTKSGVKATTDATMSQFLGANCKLNSLTKHEAMKLETAGDVELESLKMAEREKIGRAHV